MKKKNRLLALAGIGSAAATVLVLYVPFLRNAFGFAHISIAEFAVAVLIAILILPLVELIKAVQRRLGK